MAAKTGVYPVYENQFQVDTSTTGAATLKNIADMESFSVAFDNGVEEWKPFDQQGWTRRLMTAKSVTISVSGKRNVSDAGNDYIAALAFKNGRDSESDFQWTFPDGTKVMFTDAVINITELGSGDSTVVGPLAFEVMSNGKPTVTPAV
ncbi:phage tail tube protein [Enterococcus sp. AZ109]|uniref:phage tail tube protein n=1 Tax=Enterococcus sp. AZ109 TaxID=2774634 RepID=UPI003F24C100